MAFHVDADYLLHFLFEMMTNIDTKGHKQYFYASLPTGGTLVAKVEGPWISERQLNPTNNTKKKKIPVRRPVKISGVM